MSNGLAYVLFGVLTLVVGTLFLWKRRRPRPYVIGEQMARALRAEQIRLSSSGFGPSPLSADMHYDRSLGEFALSDPELVPLDNELAVLCRGFASSDPPRRTRLRNSASMDGFYTLLLFGKRSAVFAMRTREKQHVIDGLTALAMIEQDRIDFRDALGTLSLLHHAAREIGADPVDLFGKAASLAEPKMSKLILGFLKRSKDDKDIQKSWGYTVIETKGGRGFVGSSFKPYQPTFPLDQIALALAKYREKDQYQPTNVTLASDLPAVWLSSADNGVLRQALKSIRAAVTIDCGLRSQESKGLARQTLMIFLVEVSDEEVADTLFRLSEEKRNRPANYVMVGVKEDRLFCLAIERSFVAGEAPFKTASAIQRLSTGISAVLKTYTEK